jgi:cytidyltransferase-like protein
MEIEIYTDSIEYTDKNDLLRLKDIYNRDKNQYQTSVIEREPNENETMDFSKSTNYHLNNNTKVDVMELNFVDDSLLNYDKVILLEGTICSDGKRITTGSFLDLKIPYSMLTNKIKVICIKNINYKYINKIIYSKNHLFDYLLLNKNYKYGLTSGCFDILHEGHINNLKSCKKNCEKLFVCLSSDNQIKRLKGDSRPVNSLNDRINMLIQFDFIDNIILYDEINDELETELDNVMNIVNPSVWFKGNDYNKEEIFKKHPSLKSVILFELVEGKSTTNLINKINKTDKTDKINEQNIKL